MNLLHTAVLLLIILALFDAEVQAFCGRIFDRATVRELNECMQMFFPTSHTIPESVWLDRLPTDEQRQQMHSLIRQIYLASNYELHCDPSVVMGYQHLLDVIVVTRFKDKYCVIHEPIPQNGEYFRHFWGYVIVGNPRSVKRRLHHSVSHFQTDGEVANQAAYLFEATDSRTLVVAGATRDAVIGNATSECQKQFLPADSSHDNRTMFHLFNVAIYNAAKSLSNSSVFIQWHGMANTSCNDVQAFISAGSGQNSSIYTVKNAAVNRIYRRFNRVKGNAETPATFNCRLTARTNIFGRYINGVPLGDVCNTYSEDSEVHGNFIHIEQKEAAIKDLKTWKTVLEDEFNDASSNMPTKTVLYIIVILLLML
uniref:SCP domain-containing protein n=1 Tax=Syphacia muris TaxID=451379 RepID=A0A0N5AQ53_9BILA